jgi:hypothetical protein
MEDILREIAEDSSSNILASLVGINTKQDEVLEILSTISRTMDENFRHDGALFAKPGNKNYMDVEHFRAKIARLKKAMLNINEKSKQLQTRLNVVRKQTPKNRTHIVQKGPFFYRCIYPGGVRYRELPSSNAKYISSGTMISYDTRVIVAERIFINGESSVFLHVSGVGWLMENKGPMVCLEMCGPPERGFLSSRNRTSAVSKDDAEAYDGLPPLPLKDKKDTKPLKVGFAAYEEDDVDDEHSCFRDSSGQW